METLTHSSMGDFKNCPKKFYYRNRALLVPRKEKSSLQLGSAVHYGLELYYKGHSMDDAVIIVLEQFDMADKAFWSQDDFDAFEKNKAIIEGMLRGYALRFNDRDQFLQIYPEQMFKIPIINPETGYPSKTFEHSGKTDGIFQKLDGQWWLREFKTASQVDKGYIDRLKLDTQITSYMDGVQTSREIEIAGIIYTILKKPSIRQKQNETLAAFCERVIADYQDPERLDFYYHQEELFRNQDDLLEWRHEKWDIAKNINEADKHGRWYRNTSYCSQFGGCSYLPLCVQGQEALSLYKHAEQHTELAEGEPQHVSN